MNKVKETIIDIKELVIGGGTGGSGIARDSDYGFAPITPVKPIA